VDEVEKFIDVCLSLENLIDPQKPFAPKPARPDEADEDARFDAPTPEVPRLRVDKDYMESYINPAEFLDEQKRRMEADKAKTKGFPESPDRDVLGFLLEHAPLERWERDVLRIIREESYYFLPQMQTKIMNEGWATYW